MAKNIFSFHDKQPDARLFKGMVQILGITGVPVLLLTEDQAIELIGKVERLIEDKYAAAYENTNPEKVF